MIEFYYSWIKIMYIRWSIIEVYLWALRFIAIARLEPGIRKSSSYVVSSKVKTVVSDYLYKKFDNTRIYARMSVWKNSRISFLLVVKSYGLVKMNRRFAIVFPMSRIMCALKPMNLLTMPSLGITWPCQRGNSFSALHNYESYFQNSSPDWTLSFIRPSFHWH